MPETVHMMKARKGKDVDTKCGAKPKWATVWHTDVTCPDCLTMMEKKT